MLILKDNILSIICTICIAGFSDITVLKVPIQGINYQNDKDVNS